MDAATLLADVEWCETEMPTHTSALPYATHEGVFEVLGHQLRCYRLNDGSTVFNADDFEAFLGLRPNKSSHQTEGWDG